MTTLARLAAAPLVVIATAACGSVTVAPSGSSTVAGTVVDVTGIPVGGARVRIGETVTTTDAQGHFSVSGAPVPYDAAIVADPLHDAHVYLGMSDLAPTFRLLVNIDPDHLLHTAQVSATFPATLSNQPALLLDVPAGDAPLQSWGRNVGDPAGPVQTWTAQWRGASTVTAAIHAFQSQGGHYVGYDTTPITLTDGATVPWTVSFQPSPFGEKVVSIAASESVEGVWESGVSMRISVNGASAELALTDPVPPKASFVVPDFPGASFGIEVDVADQYGMTAGGVMGLAAGATGPTLQLDVKPTLIAPTTDVPVLGPGSTVEWVGGPGTAFLTFSPQTPSDPSMYLFGGDGSIPVPDLSSLGSTIPHNATYSVALLVNGSATVDEVAAHGPFLAPGNGPFYLSQAPSVLVGTP